MKKVLLLTLVLSASSALGAPALVMALGGVLSACGFRNTFNYGHGQGACENCGGY